VRCCSDVDRITEKVAERLKHELKDQVMREQEQHMRQQLQSRAMLQACLAQELEAHTCAVCYSLMAPPHAPEMLVPCGHSFCSVCVQQRKREHGSRYISSASTSYISRATTSSLRSMCCPQCSARVDTTTTNHALLQMVQALLEKRSRQCIYAVALDCRPVKLTEFLNLCPFRLESGDISLNSAHSCLPSHASPHRPSTASSAVHGAPSVYDVPAGSSDADVDKYVAEYRILSVRQRVLSNELLDIQAQVAQVTRQELQLRANFLRNRV
jgi:hypothetical protein